MSEYQFKLTETLEEASRYKTHTEEHISRELGTYDTFGLMMLTAQTWYKTKGAYRTQRRKGEPPAKDWAWHQSVFERYEPEIYMDLNFYKSDDYSKYTFEKFRVDYLRKLNYYTEHGFRKDSVMLELGVPAAVVYHSKGNKPIRIYRLYIRMEEKGEWV